MNLQNFNTPPPKLGICVYKCVYKFPVRLSVQMNGVVMGFYYERTDGRDFRNGGN